MTEERVEGRNAAEDKMLQETERMVRDLEKAADKNDAPAPHDAGNAAIVQAIGRLAEQTTSIGSFVQQTNALVQSNLNEFSKQLANTDISAQRAAEAAQATAEALTPPEEQAPEEGGEVNSATDLKELPASELQDQRSKAWWFGKAAYRHGKEKA